MTLASGFEALREGGVLRVTLRGGAAGLSRSEAAAAGRRLRADLAAALATAASDVAPTAIVLSIEGWDWALDAGAAGDPPATGPGDPDDPTHLCAALAGGAPVIAAISGTVLGEGVALVLASAYSIARTGARLGFPQAGLGQLPAGGSLRRMALRLGAQRTLECLMSARPIVARRALGLGLVDSVSVPDPTEAALAIARLIASGKQGLPPKGPVAQGLADPAAYLDAVAATRQRLSQIAPARARLVGRLADCVEAVLLLPEDQARAVEAEALRAQAADPAAAALTHLAWAGRASARHLAGTARPRPLHKVAVIGGTPLAAELAGLTVAAGFGCILVAPEGPALAEALRAIAVGQDKAVAAGTLTEARREADWARLEAGLDPARADGVDLVLEATGLDDADAGRLLARAAAVARRGAVLATALPRDLWALSERCGPRGPVLGLRLFAPLQQHRLAEVMLPAVAGLPEDLPATLAAFAQRTGRVVIRPQDGAGGIAARMLAPWPAAVAQGLAAGLPGAALRELAAELGWPSAAAPVPPEAAGIDSPEARSQWLNRLIALLANQGALLIGQGVLRHPGEADLAMVEAGGMPRDTGGPMHAADTLGLVGLRATLREMAGAGLQAAEPALLWDDLIRNARHFRDLDAD